MENPLYDYSALPRREQPALPDGKRLAVSIGVNVEHYAFGRPAMSLAPFTAELVPDPLNFGWRDYGPRVGVWRLMEIFDRLGIRPTGILNADVCGLYPEIVEEGNARGWAWVAHGSDNSTWQNGIERDDERVGIERVAETIAAAAGRRPAGWLGPVLTATMNTYDLLAELGFTYTLDWTNDDQPYDLNVSSGRLISVPYASEINDIPALVLHHHTADQFAQAIIDQFETLYAEGERSLRIMGIGLHPFLVGQPFRAGHLARALEHIARHDDVWWATSDDIAEWYLGATS